MMGKQDKQIQMIFLDMASLIPENHLQVCKTFL